MFVFPSGWQERGQRLFCPEHFILLRKLKPRISGKTSKRRTTAAQNTGPKALKKASENTTIQPRHVAASKMAALR